MAERPDCYKCKYVRNAAWRGHKTCVHPEALRVANPGGVLGLLDFFLLKRSVGGGIRPSDLNVEADQAMDSFNWPFHFDPVWLDRCDGFTPREEGPA